MSLTDFFNSMEDSCLPSDIDTKSTAFNWAAKGKGFGQFYFYMEEGILRCENECMSKEYIKRLLTQMVDDAEFDDLEE